MLSPLFVRFQVVIFVHKYTPGSEGLFISCSIFNNEFPIKDFPRSCVVKIGEMRRRNTTDLMFPDDIITSFHFLFIEIQSYAIQTNTRVMDANWYSTVRGRSHMPIHNNICRTQMGETLCWLVSVLGSCTVTVAFPLQHKLK